VPRKVFVAGEILTAADVNANLMDQAVMVFDDAAARTAAIPSPIEGMVTYLKDTDALEVFDGSAYAAIAAGFNDSEKITATNATWPVPTLGSPFVKVTVIGGGGGGGGDTAVGTAGGTTTFNAGGAGTVTAAGGARGTQGSGAQAGSAGTLGFASHNAGLGGSFSNVNGSTGGGGAITVEYLDLTGISTVNVTIGAGGAGGASTGPGGAGGRGEVIVEYVAG
jgi:hypothetical protein